MSSTKTLRARSVGSGFFAQPTDVIEAGAALIGAWVKTRRRFSMIKTLLSSRLLFYPGLAREFAALSISQKLKQPLRAEDPCYFITHRRYLHKQLSLKQRIRSALMHHSYELRTFVEGYDRTVYRGAGILLWERVVENVRATMTLVASEDCPHEGEISVVLAVDGARICRMAFAYVEGGEFGAARGETLLISRNQTERTPARDVFDRLFKQCSPQIFCLSAICGVAAANGFKSILAVRHDHQINYHAERAASFRNAYDALWERFGSIEPHGLAYEIRAPLAMRSLRDVPRSHRARARFRREFWSEIALGARQGVTAYLVSPPRQTTP